MIKLLKKYQIRSSPFNAAKDWALSNTNNQDLWLMEDDSPVALEFLDYGDGSGLPVENHACDIALEQQSDDTAVIREGQKISGPFYPDSDPQNIDGTYKRSIFSQVRTMFYNQFRNPTEMWGLENLDFELSQTKRLLTNRFRLISIPKSNFGDKILPSSVVIIDESLDNLYILADDGNGNLYAQKNLFTRFQTLGQFTNSFVQGSSSYCDWYWADQGIKNFTEQGGLDVSFAYGNVWSMESEAADTSSLSLEFQRGDLFDYHQEAVESSSVAISFLYGQNIDYPQIEAALTTTQFYSGSDNLVVFEQQGLDTSSLVMSFNSGYNTDTTQVVTSSIDSASVSLEFTSGFITTTVYTSSVGSEFSPDFATSSYGFVSGTLTFTTYEQSVGPDAMSPIKTNPMSMSVVFYGGSSY